METLVDHPSVNIQVRSVDGYAVCTECKGTGEQYRRTYYNPNSFLDGGLVSVGHRCNCNSCFGRGYWKPLQ